MRQKKKKKYFLAKILENRYKIVYSGVALLSVRKDLVKE